MDSNLCDAKVLQTMFMPEGDALGNFTWNLCHNQMVRQVTVE